MEEGVNHGCPLSLMAALVLNEVLKPIMAKLNARAASRRRNGRKGDGRRGGESYPMAYIDDCGVCLPHEDVLLFLEMFNQLGPKFGCNLNFTRTSLTSLSGRSALPVIEQEYCLFALNKILDLWTAISQ